MRRRAARGDFAQRRGMAEADCINVSTQTSSWLLLFCLSSCGGFPLESTTKRSANLFLPRGNPRTKSANCTCLPFSLSFSCARFPHFSPRPTPMMKPYKAQIPAGARRLGLRRCLVRGRAREGGGGSRANLFSSVPLQSRRNGRLVFFWELVPTFFFRLKAVLMIRVVVHAPFQFKSLSVRVCVHVCACGTCVRVPKYVNLGSKLPLHSYPRTLGQFVRK